MTPATLKRQIRRQFSRVQRQGGRCRMPQILKRAGVSLGQVFSQRRIIPGGDIRATACCADWRHCQKGDLYVALLDCHQDGHDYVQEAIARGASAVLAERALPVDVPICLVDDTREAYGRLCQALAGEPSKKMNMVGVTGSNGKTVVSMLIASVLTTAGRLPGVMGSLGYTDGVEMAPSLTTTPAPPELARWLARMTANGCTDGVIEVSSRALAQRHTEGIEFDIAVMTNLRSDHLDYHGSALNYRRVKSRIFSQLKQSGLAVINADDAGCQSILGKLGCGALTFGMVNQAELTATVLERHVSEQTFLLEAGNESVAVSTQMIGDHHVRNCLAAAAVGLVSGVDLPTIARGLESAGHIPCRLERLECGQEFGVFVDCARTPDTLTMCLKALRQVTQGRLICVLDAAANRDAQLRPLLGRVVERCADVSVLTSESVGEEEPLKIIHELIDGYDRPARAHAMPSRQKAIQWAMETAEPGDTVVMAGKGDNRYQATEKSSPKSSPETNDRELAMRWLYEVGARGLKSESLGNLLKIKKSS